MSFTSAWTTWTAAARQTTANALTMMRRKACRNDSWSGVEMSQFTEPSIGTILYVWTTVCVFEIFRLPSPIFQCDIRGELKVFFQGPLSESESLRSEHWTPQGTRIVRLRLRTPELVVDYIIIAFSFPFHFRAARAVLCPRDCTYDQRVRQAVIRPSQFSWAQPK